MDRNFKVSLKEVLKHEGGWSDHHSDPGGATMKGVTLATFRLYVNPKGTKAELKNITDAQLETVYRRQYWDKVLGAQLPDGVDFAMFDFGVNSGPSRAVKFVQKIVGTAQDGKMGPKTIEAIKKMGARTVINKLCDDRLAFLKRLKTWPTFGKGWSRRVSNVRDFALGLSSQPTPERPAVITKEVTKPVVPVAVDKEVKKKTGWLSGYLTGGGLLTSAGAWFSGMDWKVLLVMLASTAVVGVAVLLVGEWIVRRFKAIRKAVEE